MSQTQQSIPASTVPVSTLTTVWNAVGYELTIFVVTFALAMVFRGVNFGKLTGPSKSKTLKPKVMHTEKGADSSPSHSGSPRSNIQPKAAQAVAPSCGLSAKVEYMVNCANKRQAAEAIAIYEELKATGDKAAFEEALKCYKQRPVEVFGLLVQCAGRIGRPEMILLFLDDMTSAGFDRPLAFYETTMKMLASKKCYKEALSVCNLLEADGLEPSPVTLSCLVSFAVEIGDPDRAISFFERLAACSMPSIRAYMTILRVYSRRQNWPKSLALVRDMQDRQAPIDSLVLNIVLSTGVAAGQLDATKELLNEFSLLGKADVVSYNTIMKGFAQTKDGNRAIKLLDEMCEAGLKPNAITFNTAMDAAIRSSRVTDAWQVLSQMVDAGIAPDKFTCTTLMKGLPNGATPEQIAVILDLLRNVTADCDRTLCSSLFRIVIEATVQVNDPNLTARAVAQMREQRVMMPPQEYQRLLQLVLRDSTAK